MVSKQEIDKIIEWCEKIKKERARIYVIERNPFRDEIVWTMRFPLIEIDRPKEVASKNNLVYDSLMHTLWQYMNNDWRKVEPSLEISYK